MAPAFSFIETLILTVTGEGMDPVVGVGPGLSQGQESTSFNLSVPNGDNRLFSIEGRNKDGKVIFTGSATANLNGTPIQLAIAITPTQFTKVFFTPATSNPAVGETFSRTIEVFDLQDAFYLAFGLTYDPKIIEYLGAEEGDFFKQDGRPTVFQEALRNGQQGRVTVGVTRLGKVGNINGSGRLVTLSFRAIAAGTSALSFADPKKFQSQTHQEVTVDDWEDGSVTIE